MPAVAMPMMFIVAVEVMMMISQRHSDAETADRSGENASGREFAKSPQPGAQILSWCFHVTLHCRRDLGFH
jgi:hypothetical protein